MYDYKDTGITEADVVRLPSEAVMVDGEYLDLTIDGFTTLYVKGRDGMSAELETTALKTHGSILRNRRYPERTITVGIRIISDNAEEYRRIWNILAGILNKDEVELRFADEPDKYFIATPADVEQPEAGRLNVKTEITFICTDPFKYSDEKEITLDTKVIGKDGKMLIGNYIDYQGVVPTHPVIEVDFDEYGMDSGYINISRNDDAENLKETNGKNLKYWVDDYFTDYDTTKWSRNVEIYQSWDDLERCGLFHNETYNQIKYLGISSYSDDPSRKPYYGPSLTYVIDDDTYNQYQSYRGSIQVIMGCGPTYYNQFGEFMYAIADEDGNRVFYITLWKNYQANYMRFSVNFDSSHIYTKDISTTTDVYEWKISFRKIGNKFEMFCNGTSIFNVEIPSNRASKTPKKILYGFIRRANYDPLSLFGFGQYNSFITNNTWDFSDDEPTLSFGHVPDSDLEPSTTGLSGLEVFRVSDYFTSAQTGWTANEKSGDLGRYGPVISGSMGNKQTGNITYKGVSDYGDATTTMYKGPSMMYTVSENPVVSRFSSDYSYYGYFSVLMGSGPTYNSQYGFFGFYINDGDDDKSPMFTFKMQKWNSENKLRLSFTANNTHSYTIETATDATDWGFYYFKTGKNFQLYYGAPLYGGVKLMDEMLTDEQACRRPTKFTYVFQRHKDYDPLSVFGFGQVQYYNMRNLPPSYKQGFFYGDNFIIDTNDGEIKLNGNPAFSFGDILNPFDKFLIKPGINSVFYNFSDAYTANPPTVNVKYKEVYI